MDHPVALSSGEQIEFFLDTKTNPKKEIKSILSKRFKEYISEEQKCLLLNAMNLYNGRNKIIKLFEDGTINPLCMHMMQNLNQKNMIE